MSSKQSGISPISITADAKSYVNEFNDMVWRHEIPKMIEICWERP